VNQPNRKVNRGANQSVETKYATTLICEALKEIRSGRIGRAVKILDHALVLLPKIGDQEQEAASARRTAAGVGFDADRKGAS
jgi:hypothetical protein